MTQQDLLAGVPLRAGGTWTPDSSWVAPPVSSLPTRLEGVIGLDLECRDPELIERGPGWARRDGGNVVGYSLTADNWSGYLPIAHEGGGNLDPELVRRWLNDVLSDPTQVKVGANVHLYDLGWAETDGVRVAGPVYDVQWIEVLLDEHRFGYALNGLAKSYLNREKDESLLRRAAKAFGLDPKGELWRLPASFVGPYATEDSALPREILAKQLPRIDAEDLRRVFDLEHALGPMYRDMRRRGVRVDLDYFEQLRTRLRAEVEQVRAHIKHLTGIRVDLWAADSVARALDTQGLAYPRTEKKKRPSITKDWLESVDHPLTRLVRAGREKSKLAGTFIDSVVFKHQTDGRVHPEFHPLRAIEEEGDKSKGAITGRISMSNPNGQFIPRRTEEGRQIRKGFLPEEGELWSTNDFNQQEPRGVAHFAAITRRFGEPLPRALEVRDRYRNDPKTNFHHYVMEIAGLAEDPAKITNLAKIYGRGIGTTATALGISFDEAKEIFAKHERELPFIKLLAEMAQDRVREVGYVRSILGRRQRFPNWEPASFEKRDGRSFPEWRARKVWPGERLQRARLHKALNSIIQPTGADQTKSAMLALWREGLGTRILLQIHDDLPASVPDEATGLRIARVMETALPMEVPAYVKTKFGPTWGDCK